MISLLALPTFFSNLRILVKSDTKRINLIIEANKTATHLSAIFDKNELGNNLR